MPEPETVLYFLDNPFLNAYQKIRCYKKYFTYKYLFMNRPLLNNTLFLLSLLFCCTVHSQTQQPKSTKKPNILFIIIDDFGWRDINAYGSEFYETPNMDKLIKESLKFTEAYATYPRCVPSRYSIMTGMHPARLKGDGEKGERDGEGQAFNIKSPNSSIGKVMKDVGYQTFFIGKWHLGEDNFGPVGVGFDQSVAAGNAGATSSHFAPYNIARNGKTSNEAPMRDVENSPVGENLEDRLTEETIKLIKANAGKSNPFFGILAHYAVHTPIQGKEEYKQYFREKLKKMPPAVGPDYEPESAGENKLKQDNVTYAAMIKTVDDGIGKILKTIDEIGISNNTIIIVTSDHGGLSTRGNDRELATTNRPLRAGKGNLYEGGIRVPLFIKWPGVIKGGKETNAVVQGIDHLPTLVEIGGGSIPTQQILDGKSFVPLLKGQTNYTNKTLFWHNSAPRPISTGDMYSSAIRIGDYKLIDFYALGKKELYNVKQDIGERKDLSTESPQIVEQLYKELDTWRKKMGADMKIKPNSLSVQEKKIRLGSF
jgi:arylsulfatase A-like enzyme